MWDVVLDIGVVKYGVKDLLKELEKLFSADRDATVAVRRRGETVFYYVGIEEFEELKEKGRAICETTTEPFGMRIDLYDVEEDVLEVK